VVDKLICLLKSSVVSCWSHFLEEMRSTGMQRKRKQMIFPAIFQKAKYSVFFCFSFN
jgi:hypothetical protein